VDTPDKEPEEADAGRALSVPSDGLSSLVELLSKIPEAYQKSLLRPVSG
jgi:hypothetical protein